MADPSEYEGNERYYWNQSVEEHDRFSSIGIQKYPEEINEFRKQGVFPLLDEILGGIEISPHSGSVLDVGCGTGVYTEFYERWGLDAVGVDLSKNAVATASEFGSNHYCTGSAPALPFRDSSFDLVHCFSVLYHLTDDTDWETALRELARVTKRTGHLLLRIEWSESEGKIAPHYKRRSKQRYVDVLSEEDFELRSVHSIKDEPRTRVKPYSFWLAQTNVPLANRFSRILLSIAQKRGVLFKENKNEKIVLFKHKF